MRLRDGVIITDDELSRVDVDKLLRKEIYICKGQGKDRRLKTLTFKPFDQKYHFYHNGCLQDHLIGDLEDLDELIKIFNER